MNPTATTQVDAGYRYGHTGIKSWRSIDRALLVEMEMEIEDEMNRLILDVTGQIRRIDSK